MSKNLTMLLKLNNDFSYFLNSRNRKKITGPFHPNIKLNSNLFAVSLDGKYLYAAGMWDNSLRIYNTTRAKPIASIVRHLGN